MGHEADFNAMSLRDLIAGVLRELREQSELSQADMLRELGWAIGEKDKEKRRRKSALSRIENGEASVPWADLHAVAEGYGADPLALLIVQALAEVEDGAPFAPGSDQEEGADRHFVSLLQPALNLLCCENRGQLANRLISTARQTLHFVRQRLREHALSTPLLHLWRSEAQSPVLPDPRFAPLSGEYKELSFLEGLNGSGTPIVLHGTRAEGVGFPIVALLRQVERTVAVVDALTFFSSNCPVADAIADQVAPDDDDVRDWLRNLVSSEPGSETGDGSTLWLVYDHCAAALRELDTCDFLMAKRVRGAANLKHIFLFDRTVDFEDIGQRIPNARHITLAPMRPEEAASVIRPRILPKRPNFNDTALSQSVTSVSRRHIWLAQLLKRVDALSFSPAAEVPLPDVDELALDVCNAILDAEGQDDRYAAEREAIRIATKSGQLPAIRSVDTETAIYLRDVLGLPSDGFASREHDWCPGWPEKDYENIEQAREASVVIENLSAGQTLASIVNSESAWATRNKKIHVILAPFEKVLQYKDLAADLVIVQHYSQFRQLCAAGLVYPLRSRAKNTLSALHSPFARTLCYADGEWWGVPFHYPTKFACYRGEFFPDRLPGSVSELMQRLQSSRHGRDSGPPRLLLQLQPGHPCLYYEWLAFAYAQGGADVILDPLQGVQVMIDTEETIHATEVFQSLCDPQFCHEESREMDWYRVNARLATDPTVALALPFSDGIPDIFANLEKTEDDPSTEQAKRGPSLRWAPFRIRSFDGHTGHSSARVFGTRAAPMHVTTVHIMACVNPRVLDIASDFSEWIVRRDFQEQFARKAIESPLAGTSALSKIHFSDASQQLAWDATALAQQYLAPVLPPGKWDTFPKSRLEGLLNEGQQLVLKGVEEIVHHSGNVRDIFAEVGKQLRQLFDDTDES